MKRAKRLEFFQTEYLNVDRLVSKGFYLLPQSQEDKATQKVVFYFIK